MRRRHSDGVREIISSTSVVTSHQRSEEIALNNEVATILCSANANIVYRAANQRNINIPSCVNSNSVSLSEIVHSSDSTYEAYSMYFTQSRTREMIDEKRIQSTKYLE